MNTERGDKINEHPQASRIIGDSKGGGGGGGGSDYMEFSTKNYGNLLLC